MRRSRAIEITLVPDATVPGAQSIGKVPRGPANQGSGTPIVPPPSPPPTGDTDYGVLWRTAKEGYQRNLAGNPITDYDLGGTNYSFRQIKSSLYPGAVGDDNDIQWEVPVPVDMDTSDPQLQVRLHFLVPINPPIIVPASARGVGGGVGRLARGGRTTTLQARGVGGGALRGTSGRQRLFMPRGVAGSADRSTLIPGAPLPGYQFWVKSDLNSSVLHAPGTPANNNDYVQYFLDQSGNSNDEDNPDTGATNPIYKTGIQNGKAIVRFDFTASEKLFSASYTPSGQLTIFLVVATGTYNSGGFGSNIIFACTQFRSDQLSGGVCIFVKDSSLDVQIQTALGVLGSSGNDGANGTLCTFPDHNFHLIEINISSGSTLGWFDGTQTFTDNSHGAIHAGRPLTLGCGLLNTNTDYFDFWSGDIAEMLIYPSSLTSSNQAVTRRYLRSKWATP